MVLRNICYGSESMKENVLQSKSYEFALRIVETYRSLVVQQREYVLSKQLVRCGTSIGANVEEAIGSQSQREFYAKLSIAYREARETHYWLRLLRDSHFIDEPVSGPLLSDCEELLRIIGSIRKTLERNFSDNS